MSQVALRLPDSLHQYAKQLAANDDASLNQFIVMAVAEKVSALSSKAKAVKALRNVRQTPLLAGDEKH
jgi:hypothetical protein